jgi:glycosyltransferase involved in cell wall biosynthesis
VTRLVIVDWLGRGGIAQVSAAWTIELRAAGHEVTVVTRAGRELVEDVSALSAGSKSRSRIAAHIAVTGLAARVISSLRPELVVFQNYVIPTLEMRAHRAARGAGSRVVFAMHDDRHLSRAAGSHIGLTRLLRQADLLVAHTEFVASSLRRTRGAPPVEVIPHPLPLTVLAHTPPPSPETRSGSHTAIHFGVVKRGYKGSRTVLELARSGVEGWDFTIVGNGAPRGPRIASVSGYVAADELCRRVAGARASLLPYTRATQSGVVVLSQALGCVPIATAVGGLPEQIVHGSTGYLIPPHAPLSAWRTALGELSDDEPWGTIATTARRAVVDSHARFAAAVRALAGEAARGPDPRAEHYRVP